MVALMMLVALVMMVAMMMLVVMTFQLLEYQISKWGRLYLIIN